MLVCRSHSRLKKRWTKTPSTMAAKFLSFVHSSTYHYDIDDTGTQYIIYKMELRRYLPYIVNVTAVVLHTAPT